MHYLPAAELAIDESMISFSGRSKFKVFMPSKPIKVGLKAYLLCESKTGFVLNWNLHTGMITKDENLITYKIVMQLLDGYEGEGYKVFTDRYYTGMQLLADLKAMNIGASGTVQLNRLQMNKNLTKDINKLGDHEILYLKGPNSCWPLLGKIERQFCCFQITTSHMRKKEKESCEKKITGTETIEPSEKKIIPIPKAIVDYTYFLGGVDNFDLYSLYKSMLKKECWKNSFPS